MRKRRLGKDEKKEVTPEFVNMSKEILYPQIQGVTAAAAPCAWEDRPRCHALLGRRSCSGAVLPLHRYGASTGRSVPCSSGRIRVGICRRADGPCRRCRGGGGSRSPRRRRDHRHHPRFGPPDLCTCPRPSSVGVGEGKLAATFALRPSPLQFGHP
jgi:hypothetical protein